MRNNDFLLNQFIRTITRYQLNIYLKAVTEVVPRIWKSLAKQGN